MPRRAGLHSARRVRAGLGDPGGFRRDLGVAEPRPDRTRGRDTARPDPSAGSSDGHAPRDSRSEGGRGGRAWLERALPGASVGTAAGHPGRPGHPPGPVPTSQSFPCAVRHCTGSLTVSSPRPKAGNSTWRRGNESQVGKTLHLKEQTLYYIYIYNHIYIK